MTAPFLQRSTWIQIWTVMALWLALLVTHTLAPKDWTLEVTATTFVAVPAIVFALGQLFIAAHVQRAGYIKDYAVRFRTDRELNESYHYLVYRYGKDLYAALHKKDKSKEDRELIENATRDVAPDLQPFDPRKVIDSAPERRLDNLLGFFDVIGYDYSRGLLDLRDIAGVFGTQLDHFLQREAVGAYLNHVRQSWGEAKTFESAPPPYRYLTKLIQDYKKSR